MTTGYAIQALARLHEFHGHWLKAGEISSSTDIPTAYLSKILIQLGHAGLVIGKRGTFGGYALATPAENISLLDVAQAVEGKSWIADCMLGFSTCSQDHTCPTHDFWTQERTRIESILTRLTIKDAARHERQQRKHLESCRNSPETPIRRSDQFKTSALELKPTPRASNEQPCPPDHATGGVQCNF